MSTYILCNAKKLNIIKKLEPGLTNRIIAERILLPEEACDALSNSAYIFRSPNLDPSHPKAPGKHPVGEASEWMTEGVKKKQTPYARLKTHFSLQASARQSAWQNDRWRLERDDACTTVLW